MADNYKSKHSGQEIDDNIDILKRGLTTFDMMHGTEVLKVFLDGLSGSTDGNCKVTLTRDGLVYSGVNVTLRDAQGNQVAVSTTDLNGQIIFAFYKTNSNNVNINIFN